MRTPTDELQRCTIYIAVLDASINHGGELGRYHSRVYETHATYVRVLAVFRQHMEGRCVHHSVIVYSTMDYVIQENAWSSSSSTSQRMKQATSKVFIGDVSKLIYIMTNYHASDELHRGPVFFIITT